MATATELADRLNRWHFMLADNAADQQRAIAELRRIPDLEQRLAENDRSPNTATDIELDAILKLANVISTDQEFQRAIVAARGFVNRLRPQPIVWHDCGEGSIAEFGGWTLVVRPYATGIVKFIWHASRLRCLEANLDERANTLAAAKAAAEFWVRKAVAK